jgi:two-component system, cell cycle response regulator CpdR
VGQSKPINPLAVVVEDDPLQRDMIAVLLEESDFEVIQCEDAVTAELALKRRHPVLLVTDVNLVGKMTGLELANKAHQSSPALKIIVISGKSVPARLPEGAIFISKPVFPVELLREANSISG